MLSTIEDAAAAIQHGGVVVVPTDTVYGLCASATHRGAIERIYELKGRASDKPLQLLVAGVEWLELLGESSGAAQKLALAFWPGPLTIVVAASQQSPELVRSNGTIGLRAPAHPMAQELLAATGPLAATSANRTDEVTPAEIGPIREIFGDGVDVYLDGGTIKGEPSTVVDLCGLAPQILRVGTLSTADIARVLEKPI